MDDYILLFINYFKLDIMLYNNLTKISLFTKLKIVTKTHLNKEPQKTRV